MKSSADATASVTDVAGARSKWIEANERVATLATAFLSEGTGYGDPDARVQDEHRLGSARQDAERLFREYLDLDRRRTESRMLELQQSQRLATWASFAVAAVVGISTVVSTLVALFK